MANVFWRGDAKAVAGVKKGTIGGTLEVGDKFVHTINGKTATYTAASTTIATERTALIAWWNALDSTVYPEHAEITASAGSGAGEIDFTDKTPGMPSVEGLTLTTTESDGSAADSQTYSTTAVTSCTGPNHADNVANYSGGALPADGDVLIIDRGGSLLFGLSALADRSITINVMPSFDGDIGLPVFNGEYQEWRATYLQVETCTINLRSNKPKRIKIDSQSYQTTLNVFDGPKAEEDGTPGVLWKGTHASNEVNVSKGNVGLAWLAGESATVATLRMGYLESQEGDSQVYGGTGLSLTNVTKSGGYLELHNGASGTFLQTAGDSVIQAGTLTGPDIRGGTLFYNSTGTLGGAPVVSGETGYISFARDLRAKTVTNPIEVQNGVEHIIDPFQVVSNLRMDCNFVDKKLENLGPNIRLTRGAVA